MGARRKRERETEIEREREKERERKLGRYMDGLTEGWTDRFIDS
jgi:hypothetical protein